MLLHWTCKKAKANQLPTTFTPPDQGYEKNRLPGTRMLLWPGSMSRPPLQASSRNCIAHLLDIWVYILYACPCHICASVTNKWLWNTCNPCKNSIDCDRVPGNPCDSVCNANACKVATIFMMPCLGQLWHNWYLLSGNKESVKKASHSKTGSPRTTSLRALRSRVHSTSSKKSDEHWRPQKWQKPKLPSLAVRWEQDVNTVDSIPHTAKHTASIMRWIEVRTKTWSWARRGALLLAALPL